MKQKTPKIAVIGAGSWGQNLVRVFNHLPTADLTVVCDLDADVLDRMGANYKWPRLSRSADDTIADSDIDGVVIALPASMHYAYALKALEANKHCLVEKPLAMTSVQCQKLIDTAREQDRVLMVGHTFVYNSAVRLIGDLIDAGDLGRLFSVFSQRLSLGQVRKDVDVIWNLAPHDISIILYWMKGAEPLWVSAQGFSHLQTGRADLGTITMEFACGIHAHVIVSWLSPEKIRKIMVTGSQKMIVYDDTSPDSKVQVFDKGADVHWADHEGFGEFQVKLRAGEVHTPHINFAEPLRVEAQHFVDCITTGERPLTDGENGLRVTRILEAATASIEMGGTKVRLEDRWAVNAKAS